nr:hypothetical protein [Halopenitus persicus]
MDRSHERPVDFVASVRMRFLRDVVKVRSVWAVVATVRTPELLHYFCVALVFCNAEDIVINLCVDGELRLSVEMEQFLSMDDRFPKLFRCTIG